MRTNPLRWLYEELPGLVDRGVLTADAAESLRRHYGPLPETPVRRILLLVFGTLGALLVGSGIVLLLAHNWEELSRPVRAGLSIALLLAAQAIALWVARCRAGSAAWSEGAAGFLSLAVIACLSLISQTYNLGGDLEGLLFIWVVSMLPVVYLLRSRVAAVLTWIGATWWLMLAPWMRTSDATFWQYFVFVALAVPFLAWLHLRHRFESASAMLGWVVCGCLALAVLRIGAWSDVALWAPLYAGLTGSLYAFGLFRARSRPGDVAAWRRPFHVFGALGLGVLFIVCSFGDVWKLDWDRSAAADGGAGLVVSLAIALLLSGGATVAGLRLLRRREWEHGLLACTPALILPAWWAGFQHANAKTIMLAVSLFALAVGITICVRGVRSGHLGPANAGLLLAVAVLAVRFFDADLSFVLRGIGFIVLGAGFLAMNLWMLRHRHTEVQP